MGRKRILGKVRLLVTDTLLMKNGFWKGEEYPYIVKSENTMTGQEGYLLETKERGLIRHITVYEPEITRL
jgi:hypothetical protein